jgi:hypothetical protein
LFKLWVLIKYALFCLLFFIDGPLSSMSTRDRMDLQNLLSTHWELPSIK